MKSEFLSYSAQLRNPLWKEKRDSVLKERGNKCEKCNSTDNLQVHHIKYLKDKLAWEYDNSLLECLCGNCHMKEHNVTKNKEGDLFGLNLFSLGEVSEVLRLRTLIAVNLKSEVVNYLMANCEVLKYTDKFIRFKIHPTYHKYLKNEYGYCIEFNHKGVDFILSKSIINNNLMDFISKN